jgi:hypothetical protein
MVEKLVAESRVALFSKSYCPCRCLIASSLVQSESFTDAESFQTAQGRNRSYHPINYHHRKSRSLN